jgi:hypothetical protein
MIVVRLKTTPISSFEFLKIVDEAENTWTCEVGVTLYLWVPKLYVVTGFSKICSF